VALPLLAVLQGFSTHRTMIHTRTLVFFALLFSAISPLPAQSDPESRRDAIDAIYPVMIAALEARNFGRARNICDQAIIWEPQNPVHHYNMACIEAQAGGTRLPYAMGALELAVALGFNDAAHLKNDPDLEPLHSDPKFAELVRKTALNETAIDALTDIRIPDTPPKTKPVVEALATAEPEQPAASAFKDGVPVGLYFMTRFQAVTRTSEKSAWYFTPDGAVFEDVTHGFSKADLAAHAGSKGRAGATGNKLEIIWSDGRKTVAEIERDGSGFTWDMGIFTPVRAFDDASAIVGSYEGGESLAGSSTASAISKRLELRTDGTFAWDGVAFVGAGSEADALSIGTSASKGRWQLSGYTLVLTDDRGIAWRRIAFPYDDEKTPVKPDQLFFGGLMYRKR